MKILQAGYPKSGNYWFYKILKNVFTEAGINRKSFIQNHPVYPIAKTWELSYPEQADIDMIDILYTGVFFRISSVFRRKIDNPEQYVSKCSHVWTHANYCERSKSVFRLFDKVIYIIRDPRDMILSTVKFAFTPYMQKYYPTPYKTPEEYLNNEIINLTRHWSNHVLEYLINARSVYYIFYENLLLNFDKELNNLLQFLDLELSKDQQEKIKMNTSFQSMKASSPNHVRKAKLYGWKDKLDGDYKAIIKEYAGPLLQLLHYPLYDDDDQLPFLSPDTSESDFRETHKKVNKRKLNERLNLIKEALLN